MPQMREAMQLWEDWIVANQEPSAAGAQRPVGALTGGSSYSPSVSLCSHFSANSLHFAEHVGEHSGGGVGCLA